MWSAPPLKFSVNCPQSPSIFSLSHTCALTYVDSLSLSVPIVSSSGMIMLFVFGGHLLGCLWFFVGRQQHGWVEQRQWTDRTHLWTATAVHYNAQPAYESDTSPVLLEVDHIQSWGKPVTLGQLSSRYLTAMYHVSKQRHSFP